MSVLAVATALSVVVAALACLPAVRSHVPRIPYISSPPLRDLPGPPSEHWFYGNLKQSDEDETPTWHGWLKTYGKVFKVHGPVGSALLIPTDFRALAHILSQATDYRRPERFRYILGKLLGPGLLTVEGDQHKQQRRIVNPAFGPAQMRDITSIYVEKSVELRDRWSELLSSSQASTEASPVSFAGFADDEPNVTIEVFGWLKKMTFDVIGLAGFNYDFHALNTALPPTELEQALRTLLAVVEPGASILVVLQTLFPIARWIPTRRARRIDAALETLRRIGGTLLEAGKDVERELKDVAKESTGGNGRDVLSLLVKANMASDGGTMTDAEVLAQIPTFLIAGRDTTSNAVSWALYELARHVPAQDLLRASLPPPPAEGVTMEFLNELVQLDWVVREVIRLHPPVPATSRVATRADVIPTAEEWVDAHGCRRSGIPVAAGDEILIPTFLLNHSPAIWGPDALEFKPERWREVPEAARAIPGVWGNTLTFLSGPRACIGHRFAVLEMKALLYTLVRAFRFTMAVPEEAVRAKSFIQPSPHLREKMKDGPQLPLQVSAAA
ncbi:cytochrome P450 [Auriscalpium vulgare]|uniref:Cytochrome P450 n=1 Tax=Auriscalpium vulgare TaxID=40419 RepID=A0ACB8RIR3_9AGAM|nr:cytochrome P450 [Auriscalpium vulgare]